MCRHFVRETLAVSHAHQLTAVAELVVSELVTTLVHAADPITVTLTWTAATVLIELRDRSSSLPALSDRLHRVTPLMADCQVTEHTDGDTLWINIEHRHSLGQH